MTRNTTRIPVGAAVGVDLSEMSPQFAWMRVGLFGTRQSADLGNIDASRSDIIYVADVRMSRIFTERVVFGGLSAHVAERLVEGKLDVSLPISVEECYVEAIRMRESKETAFLALALPKSEFDARVKEVSSIAKLVPECLVPRAVALWNYLCATSSGGALAQIHLHAATDDWTLLMGVGRDLYSAVALTPGDIAAVKRNLAVMALRDGLADCQISISGTPVSEQIAAELSGLGHEVHCLPCGEKFLARALAFHGVCRSEAGSFYGESSSGSRLEKRRIGRAITVAALAALLAVAGIAVDLGILSGKLGKRRTLDDKLTQNANALAGYQLPQCGMAAMQLAQNEFAKRLNPHIDAFTRMDVAAALAPIMDFATQNAVTLSEISIFDGTMSFVGVAPISVRPETLKRQLDEVAFDMTHESLDDAGRFKAQITRKGEVR